MDPGHTARDDMSMVAVKAHQADAFLNALERVPAAVLFYGTDAGSRQRARGRCSRGGWPSARAARSAPRRCRPRERSRPHQRRAADHRDVRRPQGGARAGRAARQRQCAEAARRGRQARRLSHRRGRQSAPRRGAARAVREVAGAAAVACFPDEARDLDAMVGEMLRTAGLRSRRRPSDAADRGLGADRALSRAEVEKLALFARGKGMIEEADVEAAVGDAAELALDRIVLAAGSGRSCGSSAGVRPHRRRRRERARRRSRRCSGISCACIACAAATTAADRSRT